MRQGPKRKGAEGRGDGQEIDSYRVASGTRNGVTKEEIGDGMVKQKRDGKSAEGGRVIGER